MMPKPHPLRIGIFEENNSLIPYNPVRNIIFKETKLTLLPNDHEHKFSCQADRLDSVISGFAGLKVYNNICFVRPDGIRKNNCVERVAD